MIEQFAALDLEATGMDPARHEIIEVGVIVFTRTSEIDRFESLIRPSRPVSLDIQAGEPRAAVGELPAASP